STEEVVQSFLENWAGGYSPSPDELIRSAAMGFAMGAGMSFGARVGRDPVMQGFKLVNMSNSMLGQPQITEEQWRAMSAVDRERARSISPAVKSVAEKSLADLADDQRDLDFNSWVLRQELE